MDYQNAAREVAQEVALLGLWRGGFFKHAALYGGTALRIFHGLRRFSEDLDFTLMAEGDETRIEPYLTSITEKRGEARQSQSLTGTRRFTCHLRKLWVEISLVDPMLKGRTIAS